MAHLRGHVLRGAARRLADGARLLILGIPKIANFDHRPLASAVQEDIVQLDVPICDAQAVAVVLLVYNVDQKASTVEHVGMIQVRWIPTACWVSKAQCDVDLEVTHVICFTQTPGPKSTVRVCIRGEWE